MAAKTTFGKVKSSFQEMLVFSKREISEGTVDIKGELLTFAKKTKTLMKGQQQTYPETVPDYVNVEVGGLVLLHFLVAHSRIRDDTVTCAQKASQTDVTMQTVRKKTSSWHKLLEECDIEFRCIPDLIKSVVSAKEQVSAIHSKVMELHEHLYQLEVLNAKLEIERKKNSHLLQLKMHKADKDKENKELEGRVSAKEAELLRVKMNLELKKQSERQETFQEMFNEDCNTYISTGKLERESSLTSSTKSIEDVELEDEEGKRSLDEFLEDVPSSPLHDSGDDDVAGDIVTNHQDHIKSDEEFVETVNLDNDSK